jgi:hypothetical protein
MYPRFAHSALMRATNFFWYVFSFVVGEGSRLVSFPLGMKDFKRDIHTYMDFSHPANLQKRFSQSVKCTFGVVW